MWFLTVFIKIALLPLYLFFGLLKGLLGINSDGSSSFQQYPVDNFSHEQHHNPMTRMPDNYWGKGYITSDGRLEHRPPPGATSFFDKSTGTIRSIDHYHDL